MLHKYVIQRDLANSKLKIREYAILDKKEKKQAYSVPSKEFFTFLCEETYDSSSILSSISKGVDNLIANLRTTNMYPVELKAHKIAESVMALYNSSEEGSTELFFDDLDLLAV